MLAGARVEVAPFKRNPMDFVLWKPSNPGAPSWPSPGGIAVPGRPGWHIECSAMAWGHLGEMIDIHGGGMDLVFPHHENEIAQSRCAFTTPFLARFWVHNGFLTLEGDKMAKSVGNMVSIRQLLADWPGEVLRFNMLKTHYHQPMDWTLRGLEAAANTLDEFYAVAAPRRSGERVSGVILDPLLEDLNTPRAIAALHGLRNLAQSGDRLAVDELGASLRFLGFLSSTTEEWAARSQPSKGIDPAIVERLIVARAAARDAKNFAEADRVRDELAAMGVRVKDTRDGTTWEIGRS
jgi:cysteinyl-tRNA synthetase